MKLSADTSLLRRFSDRFGKQGQILSHRAENLLDAAVALRLQRLERLLHNSGQSSRTAFIRDPGSDPERRRREIVVTALPRKRTASRKPSRRRKSR